MEKARHICQGVHQYIMMDDRQLRISPALIGFSGLYMLIAIASAVIQRNTEFVFYIVVMAVLITSLVLVHRRVNFSDGGI